MTTVIQDTTNIPAVESALDRLTRDLRERSNLMSRDEARFIVDTYYGLQKFRTRLGNQIRAHTQERDDAAVHLLRYYFRQIEALEKSIPSLMNRWASESEVGVWAMEQKGIGPVFAAGLLAHIDINRAATAGAIWRFAGLDPTVEWKKGQKRPWNADLKTLCWKIGESFTKVSGREDAFYGQLYKQRKQYEIERNESGGNAEAAARTLEKTPKHAQADIYRQGRLPDGRIQLRAQRWAVKLFLAHWHHVAYEVELGTPPPKPYAISFLDHAHEIRPPGWDCDCV